MEDKFSGVRELAERHSAAAFPDCRGEEVEGVDLVMVDSELHGCVAHFLGRAFGDDVWQAEILQRVANDLDRLVPQLPAQWSGYFAEARGLSHALLDVVSRHR